MTHQLKGIFRLIAIILSVMLNIMIVAQDGSTCDLAPQLAVGYAAQNTPGLAANMRESPTTDGNKVGEIPPEAAMAVLDGPVCADGYNWWQVNYEGLIGWVAEGADEYWLISLDMENTVIANWNAHLLTPIRSMQGEENVAYGMAVNGSMVALGTGYPNNLVRIWDYMTGEPIAVLAPEYGEDVRHLAFNDDGSLLAISGLMGDNMQIWYVGFGSQEQVYLFDTAARTLAFRPNTNQLLFFDFLDLVLWDMETEAAIFRYEEIATLASDLTFNTETQFAFSDMETIYVWEIDDDEPLLAIEHVNWVNSIAFTPDTERIVTIQCFVEGDYSGSCVHNKVIFWDIASGEQVQVIDLFEPEVVMGKNMDVLISPDGRLLVVGESYRLWIYDIASGERVALHESGQGWNIAFSDDGRYIIGGGYDDRVDVWGLNE